jgi:hypothetical protein
MQKAECHGRPLDVFDTGCGTRGLLLLLWGQGSDGQVPPPCLNRGLVMLLQLEESCTGILPLPWGSSLMLCALRPATAGPRQCKRMIAAGSRGA